MISLRSILVFATIFLGFLLENFLLQFTLPFKVYLGIGTLVFSYWVYAIPESIHAFIALIYGLLIDLFLGQAIGFYALSFVLLTYLIHIYVFTFRLFSHIQLSIFFSGITTFVMAVHYLVFSPNHYSYFLLFISFIANMGAWLFVYFSLRAFRRKFY